MIAAPDAIAVAVYDRISAAASKKSTTSHARTGETWL
jgi:hypothetical protein